MSTSKKREIFYVTTFCNKAHSLLTGDPLGENHECYRLSPTKLRIERDFGANAVEGSMRDFYPGEGHASRKQMWDRLDAIYAAVAPPMTLDTLIEQLQQLREKSPDGGDTPVVICAKGVTAKVTCVHVDTDLDGEFVVLDEHNPYYRKDK